MTTPVVEFTGEFNAGPPPRTASDSSGISAAASAGGKSGHDEDQGDQD